MRKGRIVAWINEASFFHGESDVETRISHSDKGLPNSALQFAFRDAITRLHSFLPPFLISVPFHLSACPTFLIASCNQARQADKRPKGLKPSDKELFLPTRSVDIEEEARGRRLN